MLPHGRPPAPPAGALFRVGAQQLASETGCYSLLGSVGMNGRGSSGIHSAQALSSEGAALAFHPTAICFANVGSLWLNH